MFNLLNDRISNSIVYLAFLEVITVAWFYGVNRFMDNIGNNFLDVITVSLFYGVNRFMDNIGNNFLEVITVLWFYGVNRFMDNIGTNFLNYRCRMVLRY